MKNKKDKKKPSLQFVPKEPLVWIFLIIFVSAWMFVLGVLVGRDTVPVKFDIEKLQKELVALKEAVIKKEQKRFKIDSDEVRNKTDFVFYEALKENQKDKNNGAAISKKQETKHLSKNKTVKVKKRVISGKSKIINKNKQKNLTKTDKKLTIQVASLKDSKDADEMVAKLKKKGYPAYRISSNIPEKGIWHRVRIGYFKDKAEAGSTLDELKKEKYGPILMNR
ncbi:MAG: SPOR domain-containing protein [Desulfobacteraceae bacterium]|nr:SPOR domain-containing protein [Desulfobacteraceae bacterium]MBC2720981.1 SPOR domain-containing protein [Desulfobacteraceae bacterium]